MLSDFRFQAVWRNTPSWLPVFLGRVAPDSGTQLFPLFGFLEGSI